MTPTSPPSESQAVVSSNAASDFSQVPTHDKLLGLLASGISVQSAAMAVGMLESDVRDLLGTAEFSAALSSRRSEKLEEAVQHDSNVEGLEAKALRVLEQKLPFVRSPMEAARIFQILNSSKKRSQPQESAAAEALGAQQVAILLPRAARVQLTMNASNQVIDVEGRSMATLPSRALPDLRTMSQASRAKKEELATAEQVHADKKLDSATPLKTMIGGVLKVL